MAKDPTLKDTAQRAFVSYAKAVFLMKDKEIFDVQALNTEGFAHSLGLAIPPRIRFLQRLNARMENKKDKNSVKSNAKNNKTYFNTENDDDEETPEENKSIRDKRESDDSGLSEDNNTHQMSKPVPFHVSDNDDSDDDNILKVKRKDHDVELPTEEEIAELDSNKSKKKKPVTKAAAAKKILKKKIVPNKKIVFDEEGEAVVLGKNDKKSELAQQYEKEDEGGIDIERAKMVLKEEDKFDKQVFKEKVKAKHKEEKRKLKDAKKKKKEEEQPEKDEFGESESEEEPDLSWLPDPDRIYGEKTEEEVERLMEDSEGDTKEEEDLLRPKERSKKRKVKGTIDDLETVLKKKKKHKIDQISSSLTVNEAEELAMMLLKNK